MKSGLFLFICTILFSVSLFAADGQWSSTTNSTWSNAANWSSGTIAAGSGSTATFNTSGSGAITVANDMTNLALNGIVLGGSGFVLTGSGLLMDADGAVQVTASDHTIGMPITLQGNMDYAIGSGLTLQQSGAISGDGGITLNGGVMILSAAANSYTGKTVTTSGILSFSDPAQLGDSSNDAGNLVLGDGILRYTGDSAIMDRGYTLEPGESNNRAAVIDVVEADTTLTIAGKAAAPGGVLIKTGEGTLAYTYPGYQELNKSRGSVTEASDIVYDENGSAGTNGYSLFTVDRGRVILGAPGQTNIIYGTAWVGSRTLASPRMDIIGGVTKVYNTYFTIGRGTGTTTSHQQPSMYVSNGAFVELNRFVMGYANNQPNFYSEPLLNIDNASFVVLNDCFLSENPSLLTTVTVTNSGLFQCDSKDPNKGMSLSQSAGAQTYVNIGGNSTGRTYQVRLGRGSTLSVMQNSMFELDTTPTNVVAQKLNLGAARFDSGTLAQRQTALISDWFVGATNLLVGAGDMTVDVSSHAWLDPVPREDPANPGGQLIKTGAGSLVLRPTPLNVQVNEGSLSMALSYPWLTSSVNGDLNFSSSSALEVSGANALAGWSIALNDARLSCSPYDLCYKSESWSFNGWSKSRPDGIIQLTENVGGIKGSSFLLRRYAFGGAWTASFSYRCRSTQSNPADGVAFILHNDPRGAAALGSGGEWLGYSLSGMITNSVAVGIDIYNRRIRFGKQGNFLTNIGFSGGIPNLGTLSGPTAFTISYDGVGQLTCEMVAPGFASHTFTYDVDLAAELGDNEAYVGFAAGTGGAYGQHLISNFELENGEPAPPDYCRHGGDLTLGAAEKLPVTVNPSSQQHGFVIGSLTYADHSVIDADVAEVLSATPAATLADQGMWQLTGYANWKSDGRLAVSTNANSSPGTAYTTNRYAISHSWAAHFVYDLGAHSSLPADYITFSMQNSSPANTVRPPNPGCSVMWRYYDGSIHTTEIKLYTNSVPVVLTTDISPVNFITGGLADITVAWDEVTRDITVTTIQSVGTNVTVISNVDVPTAVGANDAYIGFTAATGGQNAENIVSDFSFTSDAMLRNGYLAFDQIQGSGTLVKRGSASLGLMGSADASTADLTLRLEQGGLLLRKTAAESINTLGARSDWVFSSEGKWAPDNTLQFCEVAQNSKGTATSTRRIRVKDSWQATFKFGFGKKSNPPADAFSMFFHNDPRGPGCVGGQTSGAGYTGITKSIGLRWYFYPNNNTTLEDSTSIGRNGSWDEDSRLSHVPISLVAGETDFVVSYDSMAATLTSIMTQGATVITNIFTGVNIPTDVGDDYAYVGFGGGCGGSSGEMRVSNFNLSYDQAVDGLADEAYLANLLLPDGSENTVSLDTPLADSTFVITAAEVGDGAFLSVAPASDQIGTLAVETVTLAGDATFEVIFGSALAVSNALSGVSIIKTGSGALYLSGSVATYSGDTMLEDGTLSLPAANLPFTTDLYVNGAAKLDLDFTGKQHIHSLFVNGEAMPGGLYTATNTTWITGTGTLVVTYPPSGVLIIVR
ncbi:MAG: hypothetical protein PF904_06610 [Kiritimatiellae bacterium]|jgi:autotransporter-associated beta strand protein|nr:hypothetical protein [Kiritimatiellia bacterium]